MDPRLKKLAKLLIHYSTSVKATDKVFLECDEVATPWMAAMAEETLKTGAHVETLIGSEMIGEIRLKHATEEQLKQGGTISLLIAQTADVVLSAWGSRNTRINSG